MARIQVSTFQGIAPRIDPRLLQDAQGQIAENLKLTSLALQSWRKPVLNTSPLISGVIETLYLYDGYDQDPLDEIYDSGNISITADDEYNFIHWISIVNLVRSFKISITLYTPYDEIDIGRLIIGDYIEPAYGLSKNFTISLVEDTKQYRTAGGSLRSDINLPIKKFSFDIGVMSEADRIIMQSNLRSVGKRTDFYISLFPEEGDINKERDYSGIVKLTKIPSYTEFVLNYYKSKYEMEEV